MKFSFLWILAIASAFAEEPYFPNIRAENLNVEMRGNIGTGYVDLLKYDAGNVKLTHKSLNADVKRYSERLVISDEENTVDFNLNLSFFDNFSFVQLKAFRMLSQEKKFEFLVPNVTVKTDKGSYDLQKLAFRCSADRSTTRPPGQPFKFWVCADDGRIEFDSLISKDNTALAAAFSDDAKNPEENIESGILKTVHLEDMLVEMKDGKLTAEIYLKALIRIRMSLAGEFKYDAPKTRFVLRLDKANVAFVSIKKKVFKIFRSLNIKEITVAEPYIYIDVGQAGFNKQP